MTWSAQASRLHFESGATHDMSYTTNYPVVGLDPEGRVVVDITSEMGLDNGQPYLFGLTLCCDAFDKGMENGVFCRACYGEKSDDAGANWPTVVDKFVRSEQLVSR